MMAMCDGSFQLSPAGLPRPPRTCRRRSSIAPDRCQVVENVSCRRTGQQGLVLGQQCAPPSLAQKQGGLCQHGNRFAMIGNLNGRTRRRGCAGVRPAVSVDLPAVCADMTTVCACGSAVCACRSAPSADMAAVCACRSTVSADMAATSADVAMAQAREIATSGDGLTTCAGRSAVYACRFAACACGSAVCACRSAPPADTTAVSAEVAAVSADMAATPTVGAMARAHRDRPIWRRTRRMGWQVRHVRPHVARGLLRAVCCAGYCARAPSRSMA